MPDNISIETIDRFIKNELGHLDMAENQGDRFYFYDSGDGGPVDQRFPFATLVTGDRYDDKSDLGRDGVFRLNIGTGKSSFVRLFGADADWESPHWDFTALDRILPHPVYGMMHWTCVLNPSAPTFEDVKVLLADAYQIAAARQAEKG